jgi:hypothetical protein
MSERDAFGREKGEDPLAGMGWSSSATSRTPAPAPTPAPTPTPVSSSPILTPMPAQGPTLSAGEPLDPVMPAGAGPAWTPGPRASYTRRRRRRMTGFIVPLFIIAIVAVAIGGAVSAFNAGNSALHEITTSIDTATQNGGTTKSGKAASPGTSLLQPAGLKAALAKLPKGKLQLLRVAPDRINANVMVGSKMHVVNVAADGEVTDIATPGTSIGGTIKVNSAAPGRIAATAAKRTGRRISSVSYLVLIHILGKDEWQLYFDDGTHFSASANGKKVHRVS